MQDAVDIPELVCVHGLAGSSRWWRHLLPELRHTGPVEVVDLPRRVRPESLAVWLSERLECRARPVDLLGHSLGALVAAGVAGRRPDLVRRLVLVAPTGLLERRSPAAYGWPLVSALARCRPGFLSVLVVDAVRAGPGNLARRGWYALRADASGEVSAIRSPTLIVWGARDRLLPPRLATLWQSAIPHSQLVVIPRAGHVPMFETPAELVAIIAQFRTKPEDDLDSWAHA